MLALIIVFSFIFGAVVGSFVNMLVWRINHDQSILGRSHSDKTGQKLMLLDLIPIVSFVVFKGHSKTTGEKLPIRYPMTELGIAVLFVMAGILVYRYVPLNLNFMLQLGFIWVAVASWCLFAIYDYLYWEVDLRAVIASLIFVLFFLIVGSFTQNRPFIPELKSAIIGGTLLASIIAGIYVLTKSGGMGAGDIFLFALAGLTTGIEMALFVFLFCTNIGAIVGVVLAFKQGKFKKLKVQFAPFIAIAVLITLFWRVQLQPIGSELIEALWFLFTGRL